MDRTSLLPEEELHRRIIGVRRAVEELKSNPQRIGSSSLLTNRVFSEQPWDVELTNVTAARRTVQIAYTPEQSLLADLGGVFKMEFTTSTSGETSLVASVERLRPADGQQQWLVHLRSNGGVTLTSVRLKFYFFAQGSGSFTAQLI